MNTPQPQITPAAYHRLRFFSLHSLFGQAIRACALLLAVVGLAQSSFAYTHPGIPLTVADLDQVKAKVLAGEQPWKAGYDALAADSRSQLTYTMQGPFATVTRNPHLNRDAWMNDMQAVWNLARMWYFTGNTAYAQKSHDILLAWANTQTSFGGTEGNLDLGDYAYRYAGGADILRGTWSGWTAADTTTVQNLFANVYYTGAGDLLGPGNKGGLSISAALATAVFCDDTTRVNHVLDLLRTAPSTGFVNTLPNGEHGETGRDQGHSYGQMLAMAFTAEVLWKQGIDVFSELDNRILAMGEYYARFNLGVTTPFVPMGTTDEYYLSIWDGPGYAAEPMAFNIMKSAYVVRKGMSAPYISMKLAAQPQNMDAFMFLKSYDSSTATPLSAVTFPTATPIGTGLTNIDIGGATPAGSGTYSSGTWTVQGAGTEIWTHGSEAFHFLYKQVTGDCTMIAKVNSVQNTLANAKAGVMIRSDLNAEPTAKAWVGITPGITVESYFDGWTGMYGGSNWEAQAYPVPQIPYWVKIERRGNRITTFASPDGTSWATIVVGTFDTMPSTAYVGLALTSEVNGTLNTSTFTNVSITGGTGGAVTVPAAPLAVQASPGIGQVPLRWTTSFGATSYLVKRAPQGGSYSTIASGLVTPSYVDTTVANGTTYYYIVCAVNSAGQSADSTYDSVTPGVSLRNVATDGTASASEGNSGGGEGWVQAFDGNTGSKWLGGNAGIGWLQYDLGSAVTRVVTRYDIFSAGDVAERDPKSWQFQGSNNGSTWTTLDTQSNQTFAYRLFAKRYSISNSTAYRYYRLNITANNGGAAYGIQLSELALMAQWAVPDGTYKVIALHSGKALDVTGATTTNGTNVEQWTYGGGANQRWTVTHLGDGIVKIIGVGSGRSLDVNASSTADGANIQIWGYTAGTNQRWYLPAAATSGYFNIKSVNSGKNTDVNLGSTADGANVLQWTAGTGTNQQWSFQAP